MRLGGKRRRHLAVAPLSHNASANAAEDGQRAIERSAARLGLATQRMPSGAGHDAQMMARLSPMGMIFVLECSRDQSLAARTHRVGMIAPEDSTSCLAPVLEMDRA